MPFIYLFLTGKNIWRFWEDIVTSSGKIIDCNPLLFNLMLQLRWLTWIHPPPLGSISVKDEWRLTCDVVEEFKTTKSLILVHYKKYCYKIIVTCGIIHYYFFNYIVYVCCLFCIVIAMHWIGTNGPFLFPSTHTKLFKYNCEASDVSPVVLNSHLHASGIVSLQRFVTWESRLNVSLVYISGVQ